MSEKTSPTVRCIQGKCKKCGETIKIEIGDLTLDQFKERLAARVGYECPGRHCELSPMIGDFEWDWTPFEVPTPRTDEQYLEELRAIYPDCRIFILGSEMQGVPHLTQLKDLRHIGFGEFDSETHSYARFDSPRGSRRFYVEFQKVTRE
jgi:hypothetical protein